MKKGKFIVIDGTDGSGKGTQTDLLINSLKEKGIDVVVTDFPQYDEPSSYFVAKYLRGEYGALNDTLGSKRASLFYALDRFDKSAEMRKWLDEGKYIVSNRYVSASMGHQAGKIEDLKERDEFLDWLHDLEYNICGIPKPDQTLFLYVPPEIGQKLVDKKNDRKYTEGKKRDLLEGDLDHLKKASEAYKYVADKFDWITVDCMKEGKLLSIEEIHQKVLCSVSDVFEL